MFFLIINWLCLAGLILALGATIYLVKSQRQQRSLFISVSLFGAFLVGYLVTYNLPDEPHAAENSRELVRYETDVNSIEGSDLNINLNDHSEVGEIISNQE